MIDFAAAKACQFEFIGHIQTHLHLRTGICPDKIADFSELWTVAAPSAGKAVRDFMANEVEHFFIAALRKESFIEAYEISPSALTALTIEPCRSEIGNLPSVPEPLLYLAAGKNFCFTKIHLFASERTRQDEPARQNPNTCNTELTTPNFRYGLGLPLFYRNTLNVQV